MPAWIWAAAGVVALAGVAVALFFVVIVWPGDRKQKRLDQQGQTVVARILMAHQSLYEPKPTAIFEGAAVVFTRDNDVSDRHLAFLREVCERLEDFEADVDGDADEKAISKVLATQTSTGKEALRIPPRLTNGREVYLSTLVILRRFLPERRLTREYIYLRVLIDDQHCDVSMIGYPPRTDLES
jgi:hypothetical protein